VWPAVLLGACVTGLANYKTGTAESDTGRIDTEHTEGPTSETDEPDTDEPPSNRDQVWLYTGHGGTDSADPNGRGGLAGITSHWTSEGFSTSVLSTLPEIDLMATPRLLVFAGPGSQSSGSFGPLDVRKIETLLESEARIAFFVESCNNPHLNTVLSQLGVGIQVSDMDGPHNETILDASLHESHALTADINTLHLTDPCRLEVSTATILAHRENEATQELFMAAEHPSMGGEVIVVGDLQLIDDFGMLNQADNRSFASALADHDPETVR
jgi:hypothetical protein